MHEPFHFSNGRSNRVLPLFKCCFSGLLVWLHCYTLAIHESQTKFFTPPSLFFQICNITQWMKMSRGPCTLFYGDMCFHIDSNTESSPSDLSWILMCIVKPAACTDLEVPSMFYSCLASRRYTSCKLRSVVLFGVWSFDGWEEKKDVSTRASYAHNYNGSKGNSLIT